MTDQPDFGLSAATLAKIASVLSQHPNVDSAILYGSRAKGSFKPNSDIDLSLTGPSLDLTELLRIEIELDDLLLPYQIDLSLLDHIESSSLREHIARVGRPLYQRA